ncbi:unnamed protein product [Callosobruchus maculatus]|uniref:Uncharacterized protein n=1 Tax=Callosobruchus maculatus TaxID=64391 RepID=A0A653BEM5_CALMS|nr:unnamed protein product [Callosobruchus maculatus]
MCRRGPATATGTVVRARRDAGRQLFCRRRRRDAFDALGLPRSRNTTTTNRFTNRGYAPPEFRVLFLLAIFSDGFWVIDDQFSNGSCKGLNIEKAMPGTCG